MEHLPPPPPEIQEQPAAAKEIGNWYKLVLTFVASFSSWITLPDSPILIIHGLFAVETTVEGTVRIVHNHQVNDEDISVEYRKRQGGIENFRVEDKDKDWDKFWANISHDKPGDQFYAYENDKHNFNFLYEDQEFLNIAFFLGKKWIVRIEDAMKANNLYVPGVVDTCAAFKEFIENVVSAHCDVRFGKLEHLAGDLYGPKKIGILFNDKDWKVVASEASVKNIKATETINPKSMMLIESHTQNRVPKRVFERKNRKGRSQKKRKKNKGNQNKSKRNRGSN